MSGELLLVCEDPESQQAGEIAGRLQARLLNEIDWRQKELPKFVLILDDRGLALQQTGKKAPGPIRAEFVSGAVAHRRKFGGHSKSLNLYTGRADRIEKLEPGIKSN